METGLGGFPGNAQKSEVKKAVGKPAAAEATKAGASWDLFGKKMLERVVALGLRKLLCIQVWRF